MATRIMNNETQREYCKQWRDAWVVAGVRGTTKEEMDKFQEIWPLAEPDIWMDTEYLKRRNEAWEKHQHVLLNLSRDFSTEKEAREWMVECAKQGANYLVCLSPDNYQFCLDTMSDNSKTYYMHMNFVAQHIRWLMKE